jgi:predicted DNA-binding transcriptional regulator YafY
MIQTSARLLALLSLLQVRREWTGQELAERLEVDGRTIRRDICKLRELGYPVEAAAGVAGGYRLGSGANLPPLLLDDTEAVAVAVGLRLAASGAIAGIEETSIRAIAKLEQVLPLRLRRRVSALSQATAAFTVEGPGVDPDVLAMLAGACRDGVRLRFTYTTKDDRAGTRSVEPAAAVYSGYNWYLVAFDLERDDWRTFRLDRIQGSVVLGERGRPREVPGGDAAAFVRRSIGRIGAPDGAVVPGRVRVAAPVAHIKGYIPRGVATVEPDGPEACIVTTKGMWSRNFLVWMATLDDPITVLEPPELVDLARAIAGRLTAGTKEKPANP